MTSAACSNTTRTTPTPIDTLDTGGSVPISIGSSAGETTSPLRCQPHSCSIIAKVFQHKSASLAIATPPPSTSASTSRIHSNSATPAPRPNALPGLPRPRQSFHRLLSSSTPLPPQNHALHRQVTPRRRNGPQLWDSSWQRNEDTDSRKGYDAAEAIHLRVSERKVR
ncbi:hypothetical protein VTI74DRAFT_4680 [Chaetomium olivicolor]